MANPGPNIVAESLTRGEAVIAVSFSAASVGAATAAEQTVTVSGVAVGDFVSVNPPANTKATAVASARVTAANTVGITFVNPTAGALTPDAGTYLIRVVRPYPSAAVTTDFGVTKPLNSGPIPLSS